MKPTSRSIPHRVFDYLIFGNWLVAFVAVAFLSLTDFDGMYEVPFVYYCLLFTASLFLYSLQRVIIFFRKENWASTTLRHAWLLRNKKLLLIQTAVAGIATGVIGICYFLDLAFIKVMVPPLLCSLTYALPLFPVKGRWLRLRDFPLLKIFLIAFVWVYLTVYVCHLFSSIPVVFFLDVVPWDLLFWGAELFLLIIALTIPFDIRDLPYENQKLKTIPALLGWKSARLLAFFLLLLAFGIMLFGNAMHENYFSPLLFARITWYGIAGWMLLRTNPSRGEYFYSFGIDGLYILYALLVLAAGYI